MRFSFKKVRREDNLTHPVLITASLSIFHGMDVGSIVTRLDLPKPGQALSGDGTRNPSLHLQLLTPLGHSSSIKYTRPIYSYIS